MQSRATGKVGDSLFWQACRIHTAISITRYLMANAEGRANGAEKAQRHSELCQFYVAVVRGHDDPETVRRYWEDDFQAVRAKTRELTDYLDEQIGFPLSGEPDYDVLIPKFFEHFHALALTALTDTKDGVGG